MGPYDTVPQPETIAQLNSAPQFSPGPFIGGAQQIQPVQPVHPVQQVSPVSGEIRQMPVATTPILVAQSEQDLLTQLMEKEKQLKESDQTKAQLLSTMEFQRQLMMELMKDRMESSSSPVQQDHPASVYPMKSLPRGLAVVIGNQNFRPNPQRPQLVLNNRNGSEADVLNFENIFSVLKYDVLTRKDLTANDINSLFDQIAATDHSSYDSFVLCITSHGESNSYVFGSDSVSIDLYMLLKKIQACKTLLNKPKMFFIQACRLPSEDMVSRDSGGRIDLPRNSEADVYIAWATSRDQPAYRSPSDGSWFVCALNHVFASQAGQHDLVTMMYEVTNVVSSAEGRERGSSEPVQQCVETSSSLRGPVRFFP